MNYLVMVVEIVKSKSMNYRMLLIEMLADYTERWSEEENSDRSNVYKEVVNDIRLALEIEPNQISTIQNVNKILNE